jgi:endonuclease/exonuclease/phosphatase family metal-dependent hydrolase
MLAAVQPDLVAVQETDQEDVVPDLLRQLGAGWAPYMRGKVGVLFSPRFRRTAGWLVDMDNGGEADRRLVIAELEEKASGVRFRVGVVHLGVNFDDPDGPGPLIGEQAARLSQAREIVATVRKLSPLPLIVAGDLNERLQHPAVGVRQTLQDELGLVELRRRVPVVSGELSSFNGWRPTKPGGWLDDVLTSPAITVAGAQLVILDPAGAFPGASDHNGVAADLRIPATKGRTA